MGFPCWVAQLVRRRYPAGAADAEGGALFQARANASIVVFKWNPRKAAANLKKQRIDFHEVKRCGYLTRRCSRRRAKRVAAEHPNR